MKYIYLLILVVFISCNQNKNEQKTPSEVNNGALDSLIEYTEEGSSFIEEFQKLPVKHIPLIDSTSFDSFIDEDDIKKINVEALRLPLVFTNWFKKGYDYKVISGYRLVLSESFYSVVVTTEKGNHEMKSTLINYDFEGNIIDYKGVAYDEIAESLVRTQSKIEKNKITIYTIEWTEEKKENTTVFQINSEGKFVNTTKEELLIDKICSELGIEKSNIKEDLCTYLVLGNGREGIMVVPEIVEEGEAFFTLNTHIVVYDNVTNKITHKYFESTMTNGWVSDAIRLDQIKIDPAPYYVDEEKRAFGIRVNYYGSSRVNPYYNQTLSLFVKGEDILKKVLDKYTVELNTGEWDGSCVGEFLDEKKILIMSKNKTNAYVDIIVKNTITKTKNFISEIGDCDYKEKVINKTSVLKFDGSKYIEEGTE